MEFALPDLAALTALITPEADALGLAMVRVAWFAHGEEEDDEPVLQVMAERPATRQLAIADCAALSRRISDRFDALEAEGRDPIAQSYRLEVSSPGIDRPLTRLADFADWAGHEAKVTLAEGIDGRKALRGDLAGLDLAGPDGERVLIDDRKSGRLAFAFADIAEAKLMLTDRLIAATRPIDASGADTVEPDDADLDQDEDDMDNLTATMED